MPTSLESDTINLAGPRGRRPGKSGHREAVLFIESRMEEEGLVPFRGSSFRLDYSGRDPAVGPELTFTNLAGLIPGRCPGTGPLLFGAHYDSFLEAPSADDNAASVSVLLALARLMRGAGLGRDLVFAFFDAEESPFFGTPQMGSLRFMNEQAAGVDFACGVILDMVGHPAETGSRLVEFLFPASRELIFVTGTESGEGLPPVLEQAASGIPGLRVVPTQARYAGYTSDHMALHRAGVPFLFISSGPGMLSHTSGDTTDYVSFPRLGNVLVLVERLARLLDGADPGHEDGEGAHTCELEIRMLRKAVGWPLPVLLKLMGLPAVLRTRSDLDRLASKLAGDIRDRMGGPGGASGQPGSPSRGNL